MKPMRNDKQRDAAVRFGVRVFQVKNCEFRTIHSRTTSDDWMIQTYEYEIVAYSPKTQKYEVLCRAETPGFAHEMIESIKQELIK